MIGDVVARIVRSDGQEFVLGDGDWRIPNDGLENWANLAYGVSSVEIPSRDGAIITSKRVNATDRSIRAILMNESLKEDLRAAAIKFFNPKYTYECHLTYMGRTRWAEGEQIGFSVSNGNIYTPPELNWTILCAQPYLKSESDFGQDIAEVQPRLGFPFMSFLPVSQGSAEGCNIGFVAGKRNFAQQVTIDNRGDVPTLMSFKITTSWRVVNPTVRINDSFIKLLYTMGEDDVLELDMHSLPPKVRLNGESATHLIDRQSNLMGLEIDTGETIIQYDADDGEQYMSVVVYYNELFLGV